ncbi:Circadian oscillation regulator KaiB [Acidisarcina polymorpha]|uniref:Circadian oscillation regulator KaiB n=1 Tax=Acidisarcina polymorpha TaxID=2211140 RepID=A0A2Z5FVX7_9BACT|nr:circadian clock KaiB family protein [Acidisarcina polymorpha]AXC10667.1 Circadian oscillation regulator KaiB [Acidisarcina polymorpha]
MSARKNPIAESTPLPKALDEKNRPYLLRLYVAGGTAQSTRAIIDARRLCDDHLAGKYRLEVVDIYQRPVLARDEQIIAVPTLVRHYPKPLRRLVGDFSNAERILIALDLLVHPT